MFKSRMPAHKPNNTDDMRNHHYSAILFTHYYCKLTCHKDKPHLDDTLHTKHIMLHSYPSVDIVKSHIDDYFAEFKCNVDNLKPNERAIICNAHAMANWQLGIVPVYKFPKKEE